jgi:integrase
VSKDYTNEIGYESLLSDFKRYQKQTPKGIGMIRKGQGIYLQFKTPNTSRKPYACGSSFTLDGMVEALSKSNKVAEKLKNLDSEVEFWDWYDKEIKQVSQLVDDRLTFGEAITKVEADYWERPSRTKRKRDKTSPSDLSSWHRTYGCFYQHLPENKLVNVTDILSVIEKQKKGTRNYKYAVSAMKKLVRTIKRQDIFDTLEEISITQTENAKLQSVTMEDFLKWKDEALGLTQELSSSCNLEGRKAWMWVFSMQVVYGLRLSEVFAIANLDKSFTTHDGVNFLALNDTENIENLIYVEEITSLGTTTKTGYRLARPLIPPKYPDLIERLDIKTPLVPTNKPTSKDPLRQNKFYTRMARQRLVNWDAPFTQTHALRHLANSNGVQAGIPQEVRAQSLGHTVTMNESIYKSRQSNQTKKDLLLNSNQNAIDFVTALAEAKKLITEDENNREVIIRLLSIIYQKDSKSLTELL